MAFGGEMAMFAALGFVLLGPRRMQEVLRHFHKWKAELTSLRNALESEVADARRADAAKQADQASESPRA
jgi:hypothetical protein